MADIRTYDVYNRFRTRVRDLARSGLSWGTNNYPANALLSWFGGTTGGYYDMPTYAFLEGTDSEIDANTMRNAMLVFTRYYSRQRLARIIIRRNYTGYSSGNGYRVVYDTTALAHLTSADQLFLGQPPAGTVLAGQDIDQSDTYDYIERIRGEFNSFVRTGAAKTLSRDVCHTQCHSSCHNSRGRR